MDFVSDVKQETSREKLCYRFNAMHSMKTQSSLEALAALDENSVSHYYLRLLVLQECGNNGIFWHQFWYHLQHRYVMHTQGISSYLWQDGTYSTFTGVSKVCLWNVFIKF
jgi:hypothetical protein